MPGDVQHYILCDRLQRASHVAVAVGERLTRRTRRSESLYKLPFKGLEHAVLVVAEIIHVDRESPCRFEAHNFAHAAHKSGVAAGCQRHHCALLERLKSEVLGDERVDHADAVEEAAMPLSLDDIPSPHESTGRGVVAIAIDDENAGLFKRRGKENRGVRFVMADVYYLGQTQASELAPQIIPEPEIQEDDAAFLRHLGGR